MEWGVWGGVDWNVRLDNSAPVIRKKKKTTTTGDFMSASRHWYKGANMLTFDPLTTDHMKKASEIRCLFKVNMLTLLHCTLAI